MNIIIKYAKDNGFKRIALDDDSKFNCIDSKYKFFYDLRHVHTLTKGLPWYYKFGFKYTNKVDREKVKSNKIILDNLKTKDLNYDKFLEIIINMILSNKYYNLFGDDIRLLYKTQLHLIHLYHKYYDQSIYLFFDKFTKQYCNIMSKIYFDLYKLLNLETINKIEDLKMILFL